ncbi:MAG: DUF4911 domain-containing protein [Candidatus Binataceae bacterium]
MKSGTAPSIDSILIAIPPAEIVLFKSIVESYDNLATLRTEDPQRHRIRIYFSSEARPEAEALLASLAEQFTITRLE